MLKRDFDVLIIQDGKKQVLGARSGRRLKELISDAGIGVSFPCGGNGRCGKCVVTFTSGSPLPNDTDRHFLSKEELDAGKRILCRCVLSGECTILLEGENLEEKIAAETVKEDSVKSGKDEVSFNKYGIAIDLGTTTIAVALVGISSGGAKAHVLRASSGINHQRKYGADVISRIDAASDPDGAKDLRELALEDIAKLISEVLFENDNCISSVCIAGNTTMLHLLRGFDAAGLGSFPYEPVSVKIEKLDAGKLFGDSFTGKLQTALFDAEVTILPGISAFVGADIVSGIYCLDMGTHRGQKELLIDLGTNGEMAFFDGEELIVTSTAAGPVFEGGEISCGVASVPGAISHVSISCDAERDVITNYETIGGLEPVGLCGTGVIEAVSELARNGIISENGLLSEPFFDNGFVIDEGKDIRITQKDVRNLQLAKAAIRAGIEKLVGDKEPGKVYVAGGFGANLDIEKLKKLKMLPDSFFNKIEVVGNTSLKGCIRYLAENGDRPSEIAQNSGELRLALEDDFGDTYIEALDF